MAELDETPHKRYRCKNCGNLTRFDVTVTRRTKSSHDYTEGGELTVVEEVLEETIEEVSCRWCGSTSGVIEITSDPGHTPVEQA